MYRSKLVRERGTICQQKAHERVTICHKWYMMKRVRSWTFVEYPPPPPHFHPGVRLVML